MKKLVLGSLAFCAMCATPLLGNSTQVEPEEALKLLSQQDEQLKKCIVKVADNVYTAVGYHGATTSMIVGEDGLIIVDTLMGPKSASEAWSDLKKYGENKEVKAIIYTHSHHDHIGGASAFVGGYKPEIYAAENFGIAEGATDDVAKVKMRRNIRQFGRNLPKEEQTNRGVAPAGIYDKDNGKGFLEPTKLIKDSHYKCNIAGVDMEFYRASGETDDALFIWLPKNKVLFTGDNFYHSFPNLYAIRGTAYRNVLNWANSIGSIAKLNPDHVVAGHTMPISGKEAQHALKNYHDAIKYVYDATVEGINQGKSPEIIAQEVKLPKHLREKSYLTEFYGTIHHSVREIYVGLLGWFDGNPTTLNPLTLKERAMRVAKLAGGVDNMTKSMLKAIADEDYQWALELADTIKWLDGCDRQQLKEVKIKALRALAKREYNAPNRNYYLSYANELESGDLKDIWF